MRPLIFGLVLLFAPAALAQTPDRRGEVALPTPTYQGSTASAPIPADLHLRNRGSAVDGAGLCVPTSVLVNGRWQGVPALADGTDSTFYRWAVSNPGGSYPSKLKGHVERTVPGEEFANIEGTDPAVLDKLSKAGYPIGATMNTGAQYQYQPIHHMISLVHYRTGGYACVVDNNDPGSYHWMPASEFDARWVDGDSGWAFVWLRQRAGAAAVPMAALFFLGSTLVVAAKRRPKGHNSWPRFTLS